MSFNILGGQHQKGPSKKGALVVALYNYQGSEHGDMTFVKGDVMEIVDDTDPGTKSRDRFRFIFN